MSRRNDHEFSQLLKNAGYSLTKPRRIVFEALADSAPISMTDLCTRLADQLDRASLYRTISLYERIGVLRRVSVGRQQKFELSDLFADHHHHLSCLHCHAVVPINAAQLETFIARIAAEHDFLPKDHQVEIQGLCRPCRERLPAAAPAPAAPAARRAAAIRTAAQR